jgi:hypothetical protein
MIDMALYEATKDIPGGPIIVNKQPDPSEILAMAETGPDAAGHSVAPYYIALIVIMLGVAAAVWLT